MSGFRGLPSSSPPLLAVSCGANSKCRSLAGVRVDHLMLLSMATIQRCKSTVSKCNGKELSTNDLHVGVAASHHENVSLSSMVHHLSSPKHVCSRSKHSQDHGRRLNPICQPNTPRRLNPTCQPNTEHHDNKARARADEDKRATWMETPLRSSVLSFESCYYHQVFLSSNLNFLHFPWNGSSLVVRVHRRQLRLNGTTRKRTSLLSCGTMRPSSSPEEETRAEANNGRAVHTGPV